MKLNVILVFINPITKGMSTIQYFDLSITERNEIWGRNLHDPRGASMSNLGYEPENYPKYYTSTGFNHSNNLIYSWTQWESE